MSELTDPFDLQRFVTAQDAVYEQVCAELRGGRKEGHWIWFIFPQMRGLGSSAMANAFGIASREEAEAYLKHAVLGPRLRECTRTGEFGGGASHRPDFRVSGRLEVPLVDDVVRECGV